MNKGRDFFGRSLYRNSLHDLCGEFFCIVDKNAGKHHNRNRKDERKLGWQEKREEDGAACTYSG